MPRGEGLMFETYEEIFDKRGDRYHYAMQSYPEAREKEFRNLLKYSQVDQEDIIADIPAGGCYFKKYLQNGHLYFVESSEEFLSRCQGGLNKILCPVDDLPFKTGFFDKVYSLAGTHHLEDKRPLFAEVHRVLKTDGDFVYADVKTGSREDDFLNIFVDRYNSMGHKGIFINEATIAAMERFGLKVQTAEYLDFTWNFASEADMIDFVKNLFGLDLAANDDEILRGIDSYLGYHQEDGKVYMNWGLYYLHATKAST